MEAAEAVHSPQHICIIGNSVGFYPVEAVIVKLYRSVYNIVVIAHLRTYRSAVYQRVVREAEARNHSKAIGFLQEFICSELCLVSDKNIAHYNCGYCKNNRNPERQLLIRQLEKLGHLCCCRISRADIDYVLRYLRRKYSDHRYKHYGKSTPLKAVLHIYLAVFKGISRHKASDKYRHIEPACVIVVVEKHEAGIKNGDKRKQKAYRHKPLCPVFFLVLDERYDTCHREKRKICRYACPSCR